MIQIREYLTTKIIKSSKIKATDDTIHQIVKEEMDMYGHDCDLNHVDVSEVTDMYNLFNCCKDNYLGESYSDLNPNISEWNVSNVKNMYCMFYECKNFNCNISKWDISKVTDMEYMFYECKNFNQDLSKWDVSNVKYNGHIFDNCQIEEKYKPKFK